MSYSEAFPSPRSNEEKSFLASELAFRFELVGFRGAMNFSVLWRTQLLALALCNNGGNEEGKHTQFIVPGDSSGQTSSARSGIWR